MTEDELATYIVEAFPRVATQAAYGYRFFFYGDERKLPFATMAGADNEHDSVSKLDRPGVFRLNIGVRPETYVRLLGQRPAKPGPAGVVETGHDFTALDQILPHPHYAPQSWICILSPSPARFEETVKPLLTEAYEIAARRGDAH